jgi:hypothetical protein
MEKTMQRRTGSDEWMLQLLLLPSTAAVVLLCFVSSSRLTLYIDTTHIPLTHIHSNEISSLKAQLAPRLRSTHSE